MKRYSISLTGVLVVLLSYGVFGQIYTMKIIGTGSAPGCGGPRSFKLDLFNQGGTLISTQSTNDFGATITYSFSSIPVTFKVSALGQDQCGGSSPQIPVFASLNQTFSLSSTNADPCGTFSWSSLGEYNLNVTVTVSKSIPNPVENSSDNCLPVKNLVINDNDISYDWQVSESISGPFVTFKSNAPNNINATIDDLSRPGFITSKYANRYIRVVGTGCQRTSGFIVVKFDVPMPEFTLTEVKPKCYGESTGSIVVNILSADPALVDDFLVRLFDPLISMSTAIQQADLVNSNSHTFRNLDSRQFIVRVQNNTSSTLGSCYSSKNAEITNPPPVTVSTLGDVVQISCNSGNSGPRNNGIIQLLVADGTSPFTYEVSKNGGAFTTIAPDNPITPTPSFSSLSFGSYSFKVIDNKGCKSSETAPIDLINPQLLSVDLGFKTDVLCKNKNTGAIDLTVSGGNGGYNFDWIATGDYAPYTIPSVEDPTNLFAGDYALTVTDSKGCSNAVPVNVSITEPASPVIVTATVPSRALHGGSDMTCALNDGIIELDIENEAFPINSYTWTKNGAPFSPSSFEYAENLTPGIYEVTILDNNNCDATTSVTLNPHPGITAITKATSDYNGFHTKCPDTDEGTGLVESVTNGFGTISYTWFDGSTNQSISDLLPGNYAVTVTDGNGCSDDATLVITPPPAIQLNIQIISNHNGESISCPDALDGAMEVFPTNGFGTYTYLWEHGPNTKSLSGLGQGTYAVTVTDDYGCSARSELLISDPVTMQLNFTKTSYNGADLSCHDDTDGEIQLTIVNGIAPYNYSWSEGSSSQNISGLSAGDYTVTVTDQNNCVQTKNVTINNPLPLILDLQHPNDRNGFDISCNGLADGSATAFLDGGTAPYSYLWSSGQITETISGQSSGTYTVQVRDANNCPNSGAITLIEPPLLEATSTIDNPVSCFGGTDGQISLSGTGGAGTYIYSLGGGTYQPSNIFVGLDNGPKNLFIKDGNGCIAPTVETMIQPDAIAINFQDIIDAKCNDPVGSARAVVVGGNGGYNYSWVNDATGQPMNTGETLVGAIASIYRVDILDAKNCAASELVAVSSIGGAVFDVENIMGVTCYGFSDGSAEVNVSSGIEPYSYAWSDGQSQSIANDLAAGNYFATVTDGLGCRTIKPLIISSPAPMTSDYTKILPNCVGDCDGVITASASGGTLPYQYEWTSLSQVSATVSGLCKGDYSLRITDSKNCLLEETVILPDPDALQVIADFTRPICLGRCDGSIEVSGQGGTGPYQFQWEDGATAALYQALCPGDYRVTMTDTHGCSITETKTLIEGDPLPIDLGGEVTLCVGQSKTLDAGANWASVNWTSALGFTSTSPSITITEPDTYFLTAIDGIGCIGLDTFKLDTSLDLLQAEFIMPSEVIVGDTLVAIDISWPLPDKVEWSHPASFNLLASNNPDFLFAIVSQAGVFKVGMQSFLAECRDFREKELIVLADQKESNSGRLGYKDALVQQFSVYPNPNDGRFDVNVLLREEKEIQLRVINFPTGSVEARYDGRSMDLHQVPFDLGNLSQGLYFILLRVGGEQQSIRFVKK
ncbi:MAG: T9SS type A sorting domain-containing protein [Cyclobacteriaceae bacterium]